MTMLFHIEALSIVVKSLTAKLANNGESSTRKTVRGNSQSSSSTRRVNKPEGKFYKSALRVDSNLICSKCPKIPLPRSDGTIPVEKTITAVQMKQELIDRDFTPISRSIKDVVTSTDKNAKQSVNSTRKNIYLNTESYLVETLNRAGTKPWVKVKSSLTQ